MPFWQDKAALNPIGQLGPQGRRQVTYLAPLARQLQPLHKTQAKHFPPGSLA